MTSSDMRELCCIFCLCLILGYSLNFVMDDEEKNTKFTKPVLNVYGNMYLNILSTRSHFGKCLAHEFRNVKLPEVDDANLRNSFGQISEIFVIHYSKSIQRYKFIKSVLQTYNLTARFVTDFNREKIPDLLSCAHKTTGALTNSEISVKTGHIAVYYMMAKNNIFNALILEDDAFVVSKERAMFVKTMDNMLSQLFLRYDVFFPGGCSDPWRPDYFLCKPDEELVCRRSESRCAHAYVVTNKGAKKILLNMKAKLDHMPIDHMINHENLVMYWSNPVLFKQYENIEHVTCRESQSC